MIKKSKSTNLKIQKTQYSDIIWIINKIYKLKNKNKKK